MVNRDARVSQDGSTADPYLHKSLAVDEEITGLDVAMDAPLPLEVDQSPQYLECHARQNALGDGPNLRKPVHSSEQPIFVEL